MVREGASRPAAPEAETRVSAARCGAVAVADRSASAPAALPVSSAQDAPLPDDAAPPPVFSDRRSIREDMRYRVLRTLETNPDLSQRALARELNVSLGALHYCLRALMEKGLVKARNFAASSNKTRYAYVLTPAGIAEKSALTRSFLTRKRAEYAALQAEILALEAELVAAADQSVNETKRG